MYKQFFEGNTEEEIVIYNKKKYYVEWNNADKRINVSTDKDSEIFNISATRGSEYTSLMKYLGSQQAKTGHIQKSDAEKIIKYYFEVL